MYARRLALKAALCSYSLCLHRPEHDCCALLTAKNHLPQMHLLSRSRSFNSARSIAQCAVAASISVGPLTRLKFSPKSKAPSFQTTSFHDGYGIISLFNSAPALRNLLVCLLFATKQLNSFSRARSLSILCLPPFEYALAGNSSFSHERTFSRQFSTDFVSRLFNTRLSCINCVLKVFLLSALCQA